MSFLNQMSVLNHLPAVPVTALTSPAKVLIGALIFLAGPVISATGMA